MSDSDRPRLRLAAGAWWISRLSSLVILLFGAFMLWGHLFGQEGRPSRPLVIQDYVAIGLLAASFAGLALAWKWEILGSGLTLVATGLGALLNPYVLAFPLALIPITALLFLSGRYLRRSARDDMPSRS